MFQIEADAAVEMYGRVAGTQNYLKVIAFYQRVDPYALSLCFDSGDTQTIWRIARDVAWETFIYGKASGIGDVRLCLVEHDMVLLRLTSPILGAIPPGPPDESMEIVLGRRPLASMLRRSAIVVPRGAEFHHIDVDRLIAQIMRECS